ncbi:hypothetical protein ACFQWC_16145 [Rossellomorea sp. GCM10028870]|uniref:hypothetical protein n=1 Tax=Rossellomorea sp. GCM10028870 TaxID=3273426 RepID=UPI0036124B34
MKNHNEDNLSKNLPPLQLNDEAKERIHTAILHHEPSPASRMKAWKEGRFKSFAAAAVGLLVFSILTLYVISETEKEKANQLFADAEENIQAVYEEMELNLQETEEGGLLKTIEPSELKSAQVSLKNAEKEMLKSGEEKERELRQHLIPMMKEIEDYNQIVPVANELQQDINDIRSLLEKSPLEEKMADKVASIKKELADKLKTFDKLESPSLRAFFTNQYSTQVNRMDQTFSQYKEVQEEIENLKAIAEEQSLNEEDFGQEAERVMKQVTILPDNQTTAEMKEEIESAKDAFDQVKEEAENKKRLEEEASLEKEKVSSGEVRSASADEKEKEDTNQDSPEDELYPMEFTMTDSNGHTFKLSRDFEIYKIGKGYDDIAKRYGGRFYYTPNSDMSHVIIGRKIIATISLVSAADVEYKDLFIDLMSLRSKKYTRDQFASIVETVIQSGEPYKVEEGDSGELLQVKNGVLVYHGW